MIRTVLNGKIHRVAVTGADLNYVGSITVDPLLLEAANMQPFEKVQVVNVTNGNRWETYIILGETGSGVCQVNGAGARLVALGDILILMTYVQVAEPIPPDWSPRVVFVDSRNRMTGVLGMDVMGHPGTFPEELAALYED